MRFLFCFIFNDLKSLKMAAHPYAAETLNKSEFPKIAGLCVMTQSKRLRKRSSSAGVHPSGSIKASQASM